jgi:hypothetical protein
MFIYSIGKLNQKQRISEKKDFVESNAEKSMESLCNWLYGYAAMRPFFLVFCFHY